MVIAVGAKTDVGLKRSHNEDNLCVDSDLGLYVVCDGMGGRNAGEVASRLAVETILKHFQATRDNADLPLVGDYDRQFSAKTNRLASAIRRHPFTRRKGPLQRGEWSGDLKHVHPVRFPHELQRVDHAAQPLAPPVVRVPDDPPFPRRRDGSRRQQQVGRQVPAPQQWLPIAGPQLGVPGQFRARPRARGKEDPLVELEFRAGVRRPRLRLDFRQMHQRFVQLPVEQAAQRQGADHSQEEGQGQHSARRSQGEGHPKRVVHASVATGRRA